MTEQLIRKRLRELGLAMRKHPQRQNYTLILPNSRSVVSTGHTLSSLAAWLGVKI